MKTVIQRVKWGRVRVDGEIVGEIERGLVVFVGVERGDTEADARITARKLAGMRIFPGKSPMDLNVQDVGGGVLVVSQFTLAANVAKGRRPSFNRAEDPERADALYQCVADTLRETGLPVATGVFGAKMEVEILNDGPVTLLIFTEAGVIL